MITFGEIYKSICAEQEEELGRCGKKGRTWAYGSHFVFGISTLEAQSESYRCEIWGQVLV